MGIKGKSLTTGINSVELSNGYGTLCRIMAFLVMIGGFFVAVYKTDSANIMNAVYIEQGMVAFRSYVSYVIIVYIGASLIAGGFLFCMAELLDKVVKPAD